MIDHARPPLAVREQSPELARQVERPPSPWRTVAIGWVVTWHSNVFQFLGPPPPRWASLGPVLLAAADRVEVRS